MIRLRGWVQRRLVDRSEEAPRPDGWIPRASSAAVRSAPRYAARAVANEQALYEAPVEAFEPPAPEPEALRLSFAEMTAILASHDSAIAPPVELPTAPEPTAVPDESPKEPVRVRSSSEELEPVDSVSSALPEATAASEPPASEQAVHSQAKAPPAAPTSAAAPVVRRTPAQRAVEETAEAVMSPEPAAPEPAAAPDESPKQPMGVHSSSEELQPVDGVPSAQPATTATSEPPAPERAAQRRAEALPEAPAPAAAPVVRRTRARQAVERAAEAVVSSALPPERASPEPAADQGESGVAETAPEAPPVDVPDVLAPQSTVAEEVMVARVPVPEEPSVSEAPAAAVPTAIPKEAAYAVVEQGMRLPATDAPVGDAGEELQAHYEELSELDSPPERALAQAPLRRTAARAAARTAPASPLPEPAARPEPAEHTASPAAPAAVHRHAAARVRAVTRLPRDESPDVVAEAPSAEQPIRLEQALGLEPAAAPEVADESPVTESDMSEMTPPAQAALERSGTPSARPTLRAVEPRPTREVTVQRRYVSAPQQEAPPAVPEASAPPPQVVTVNRLPMELPVRRVREHVQRAPDEEPAAASQTAAPQPEAPPPAAAQAPDIDALAEQVYRRLAKQLRIDSYRRGTR